MHSVVNVALLASVAGAASLNQQATEGAAGNPIRRVVSMLQHIQQNVEKEANTEQALYDKYMCYCKTGSGSLEQSVSAADAKIPQVGSSIQELEALKAQLVADLKNHQADRSEAKAAIATADALRTKTAKAFAKEKSDYETNIAAISKAVASLSKGALGGFLQTDAAQSLRDLFQTQADVSDGDRDMILAFLSSGSDDEASYVPQSGQITGLLKQLGDDMAKHLADATADETASIKAHGDLVAAKTKQIHTLVAAIEKKTIRSGETAVNLVVMKKDLTDTQAARLEDTKFLADLEHNCAQKEAEWATISATRSEELLSIAETIKLLTDDDSLELFKAALPGAAASFVQVNTRQTEMKSRAMAAIREARNRLEGCFVRGGCHQLDFIMLALHGQRAGFEKVVKMIDAMVNNLKKEQQDDDVKASYCAKEFDASDDKKKGLERDVSDSEAAAADAEEAIATLSSEVEALKDGIRALDKSVADASEQRKQENAEFTQMMSEHTAAHQLLTMAKNRLQKFYNPKLYVPPPKRELSEEDRVAVSMGGTAPPTPAPGGIAGTDITAFVQMSAWSSVDDAPDAPPKSFSVYSKAEETTGVIGMMDLLLKDLDKEMQQGETEEKDAQTDYEQMAGDAAAKRAADAESVTEKEFAKANAESSLQSHQDAKASSTKELLGTLEYVQSLHAECDWLLKYFSVREEARASEVDALKKAKAVLSGAEYSLLQTRVRSLRGSL